MIRVVILEPDPMVRRILEDTARHLQAFEVVCSTQRLEGVKDLRQGLILGETQCPDGNLCDWMAGHRLDGGAVDFIPVTGDHSYNAYRRAMQLGASDYILKPFETARVVQALERYAGMMQELTPDRLVEQRMLDELCGRRRRVSEDAINAKTYERVWRYAAERGRAFAAKEAAMEMGMSAVTVRKYLDRMCQEGRLRIETQYGKVGRPIYRYYLEDYKEEEQTE